ncbi:cell receptor alpha chain [Podarcis lilfordi]|uniref:Cell receptor alpha chain n=1 Tax=Podarcis lilfordi TaxID=74358 RepID=A0AA35L7K4_9SAUR|nr:cell receptor alpha chain [Podarcis lilfordi]
MQLCLTVLVAFLLLPKPGISQTDSVSQSQRQMESPEGQVVTFDCKFTSGDSFPYLFWYRQYADRRPQILLRATKADQNPKAEEKFSASLDIIKRTVPLTVEGVSLQDAAVYYCALSGTVSQP